LAAIYWYTVEFGICKQGKDLKIYGAGPLAGSTDMDHCFSGIPKFYPLDPFEIVENHLGYPISSK
jgi:phenylalanine-4-hydroxylase